MVPRGRVLATMSVVSGNAYVDTIGCDFYCRSDGRNIGVASNLLVFLRMHRDLCVLKNRPASYPEVEVAIHNDPDSPSPTAAT